jgi:ABC-type transport system involved in multi-copper enzyme maturation permease subunit
MMEGMPKWMAQSAAAQQNFPVFLSANWFDKNLIQFAIVLSILLGMSVFAREIEDHTIEFLLARPLSRRKIFLEKTLYQLVLIFLIMLFNTIVLGISGVIGDYNINFFRLLIGLIPVFGKCFIVYSTAVLFSLFFDDQVRAGLFTFVTIILVWATSFIDTLDFLNIFSYGEVTPYYTQGILPIMDLVLLFIVGFVIYGLSYYRFEVRDF